MGRTSAAEDVPENGVSELDDTNVPNANAQEPMKKMRSLETFKNELTHACKRFLNDIKFHLRRVLEKKSAY